MKIDLKQALKKGLPIAVATTLVFSYGVDASLAKGKPKHAGGPKVKVEQKGYSDTKGYWGEDSIDKMSALGVIQGYADGTFQPDKPVTQQEAIVLVVRLLGLEEEAKKRAEEGVTLPFRNSASIASWAYGHVDVALELGLIEGSHVFQANRAASRMYVTALMVEGLDLELSDYESIEVGFSDISSLSAEERLQLAVAVTEELANGYGNKKFHPNKPVTRGEMVAFLERMMDHLDDEDIYRQRIEGTFTSVNTTAGTITVKQEVEISSNQRVWQNKTYLLADEYVVYYNGKKRSSFDLFEAEDTIEIILNKDGKVIFIQGEAKNDEDVIWDNLEGISTFNLKLSSGQNKIDYVYDADEAEEIYVLSQINGQSTLLRGAEASVAIKAIVDAYLKEDDQFDVNAVSTALANMVKVNSSSVSSVKLTYVTDTKTLSFDVQKGASSEATILTWSKGEATLSYTKTKDQNNKTVTYLEFKDPTSNNEIKYNKVLNGTTVTATGILKINGITISIQDTSLEPTIRSIIANYDLNITF
jgi:hypothetical protein